MNISCNNQSNKKLSENQINKKVDEMIEMMNIDEKIGQMTQIDQRFLDTITDISTYSIGSLLSGGGSHPHVNEPQAWLDMYNKYQSESLKSRLQIPLIYGIDAVHGHNNVYGATIFPQNIGLGATNNPDLIYKISEATSIEVAATGIDWTFAPCLSSPEDYRWGRTYEGFSSDPKRVEKLGEAAILGYQNAETNSGKNIVACAKHFIGDGNTQFGTGMRGLVDRGNTEMSVEELKLKLIPKYQAAVDANVQTVMASYNSWNGVKCHASKELLTEILKIEMGFKGFVISDWQGIDEIPGDYKSDIITSINAGIDMVMVSGEAQPYKKFMRLLKESIKEGSITMERIDDAVKRILKVKLGNGLFDNPLVANDALSTIGSDNHRKIARQAVRESVVLLKNRDIIPISKELNKLVISGRGADNLGMQCGGWTIDWQGGQGDITVGTTILEGIKNSVSDQTKIIYSKDALDIDDSNGDLAIVVIGEDPYTEFFGDRNDLDLMDEDLTTIENLKNKGYKVVVLLISGRPMNISDHIENWDAFAAIWLPGTEGDGVSDILFGDFKSSGTLSYPWPINTENGANAAKDDLLFNIGFGL
jgi:beta-glucosidase|tara:strand:+ start:7941 stop:9710 length:1770 start_codon:yes stop_codon:yes gene_type:complete